MIDHTLTLIPRVLITGARAPAALHLARLLNDAGCHVVLADTLRWPFARYSRACKTYCRIASPVDNWDGFASDVSKIVSDHQIELVVPTCEEVFHLARLWKKHPMSADLFAPSMEQLSIAHNKFSFIEQVKALGLAVPSTKLLTSSDDINKGDSERVLKPVWSRFGESVHIRPSLSMLQDILPSDEYPWISQEFVEGREICATAFARDGKLLGCAAYHPLYRAGLGAAIYFEPVSQQIVMPFIEKYVEATEWTGQISFDLIQTDDGTIVPLECNPRSTSGLHFFQDASQFACSLLSGVGMMDVDQSKAQSIKLAMLTYGAVHSLKKRTLGNLRRDISRSRNALDWKNDAKPLYFQWLTILEFAVRAVRSRSSLIAATTRDIQWDGES